LRAVEWVAAYTEDAGVVDLVVRANDEGRGEQDDAHDADRLGSSERSAISYARQPHRARTRGRQRDVRARVPRCSHRGTGGRGGVVRARTRGTVSARDRQAWSATTSSLSMPVCASRRARGQISSVGITRYTVTHGGRDSWTTGNRRRAGQAWSTVDLNPGGRADPTQRSCGRAQSAEPRPCHAPAVGRAYRRRPLPDSCGRADDRPHHLVDRYRLGVYRGRA
jgi:hypothetical protein